MLLKPERISMMKISVVIPNWNGKELLKENLPSVLDMGADENIIVDDGSTDESIELIENSKLKIIKHEKNLGFAKSVNDGVVRAKGDIIILLNTDVKPHPGLIKVILPYFKDPKVFGVSFAEEKFSYSCGFWKDGFVEHKPGPIMNKTHPTFWISGGSGAFRKSIWDKLGGFDLIYKPFYWEDVDLCYRALKLGYKLLWVPDAKVIHQHEGTIGKYFSRGYMDFVQQRNQLLFIWKNIISGEMIKEHFYGLCRRLITSPGYIKIILAALSKWPYINKARIKEKKESIVSDEQVFQQFN